MIRVLGGIVGRAEDADALARRLEAGLDDVRRLAARLPRRPRVFFEEWDDPLISGICWVDELVEIAGGEPLFPELRAQPLAKGRILSPEAVRGMRSGGHHRVVVRQGDEEADDRGASGLVGDVGRAWGSCLRDQVELHPAARASVADRRRAPAARVHRPGGRRAGCTVIIRIGAASSVGLAGSGRSAPPSIRHAGEARHRRSGGARGELGTLDQLQKLHPRARVVAEHAEHGAGDRAPSSASRRRASTCTGAWPR